MAIKGSVKLLYAANAIKTSSATDEVNRLTEDANLLMIIT